MRRFDKAELGRLAREHGFARDTFEKVVRLTDILRIVNNDGFLQNHLVLKGGTAINLAILNLPRLSVDIDFDYTPNDPKEAMLENRERITSLLKERMESEGYSLTTETRSRFSLDSFVYRFTNSGGNPDAIKIEINYSLRAHIFEPITKKVLQFLQKKIFETLTCIFLVMTNNRSIFLLIVRLILIILKEEERNVPDCHAIQEQLRRIYGACLKRGHLCHQEQ